MIKRQPLLPRLVGVAGRCLSSIGQERGIPTARAISVARHCAWFDQYRPQLPGHVPKVCRGLNRVQMASQVGDTP